MSWLIGRLIGDFGMDDCPACGSELDYSDGDYGKCLSCGYEDVGEAVGCEWLRFE